MSYLVSRIHEAFCRKEFSQNSRKEVLLNTATDGTTARAIQRTIKRAGKAGIVDLGPGKFPGLAINQVIELISREYGLTAFSGTVRVEGGPVVFRGIRFQSPHETPTIIVRSGTLLCEDCEFFGPIHVQASGSLHLKNCLLAAKGIGLSLTQKSRAEIIGSRISGHPAGIIVADKASLALLACRLENCGETSLESAGSAIFCDTTAESPLVIEGTEFFRNQVGLYVKSAPSIHIQNCHFRGQKVSSLICEAAPRPPEIVIRDSVIESPKTCDYPALSIQGGKVRFDRVAVTSSAGVGLMASAATLEVQASRISSRLAVAVDLQGGELTSKDSTFVSEKASGLRTSGTQGSISKGTILGHPPHTVVGSHEMELVDVSHTSSSEGPPETVSQPPPTIQAITDPLSGIIGQTAVKTEIERLLRQAFAIRERRRQGLPQDLTSYSGIVTGPSHTGQLAALEILASGLHLLGEIDSPRVRTVLRSELPGLAAGSENSGLLFVTADDNQKSMPLPQDIADAILHIHRAQGRRTPLFIEGEREALQGLFRSRIELMREFPIELPFAPFGPAELAELFADHCRKEKIRLSSDALRKIPVMFHSFHDHFRRRFLHADGVLEIFVIARRHYLDRCAREGRFDLEMEDEDIAILVDQEAAALLRHAAELVVVCPACNTQIPWLPGLAPVFHCRNCNTEFRAPWGIPRNSAFLRKRSLSQLPMRTGAIASRRNLTAAAYL